MRASMPRVCASAGEASERTLLFPSQELGLMSFSWEYDREFDGPAGLIRVLQREVRGTYEGDIAPFREIESLWSLEVAGRPAMRFIAKLDRVEVSSAGDVFHLRQSGTSSNLSSFLVASPIARRLTVWRIEDHLDMLQLRVAGVSASVYSQLGGARAVPLLLSGAVEFEEARVIYLEGGNTRGA